MGIRSRVKASLAGLALLAVAAAAGPAVAQAKLVLQTGAASPGMFVSNIFVGQQAGFFREEGIDVEIRYSAGGPLATQIVASGGADIGDVTFEGLVLGYEKGIRGKFIFSRYNQLIYFMAVPEGGPIKSPADLADKKIGLASMGSASLIIAKSILRANGIEPKTEMFLPVGLGDSAIAALRSNQVQALSLIDFAYAGLERSGQKFRYFFHPVLENTGNGGYLVTDKTLREKRDTVVRFLRALVKSHVFIQTNPEAAVRIYWKANPAAKIGATEQEALAKGLEELRFRSVFFSEPPGGKIGGFAVEGIRNYIRILKEEGVIPAEIATDEFIALDLIEEANKVDVEAARKLAREWK